MFIRPSPDCFIIQPGPLQWTFGKKIAKVGSQFCQMDLPKFQKTFCNFYVTLLTWILKRSLLVWTQGITVRFKTPKENENNWTVNSDIFFDISIRQMHYQMNGKGRIEKNFIKTRPSFWVSLDNVFYHTKACLK